MFFLPRFMNHMKSYEIKVHILRLVCPLIYFFFEISVALYSFIFISYVMLFVLRKSFFYLSSGYIIQRHSLAAWLLPAVTFDIIVSCILHRPGGCLNLGFLTPCLHHFALSLGFRRVFSGSAASTLLVFEQYQ